MDGYHIALFVHFVALFIAVATSSRVHFFADRRAKAETVRETLEWHTLLMSAAKGFPIAVVLLVLTGSYMVSKGGALAWSTGFVIAGFTGVVLLLASGNILAARGRGFARRLEQRIRDGEGANPLGMPGDIVSATLLRANFGIVVAVVFDMTLKPTLVDALGVLALGIAIPVVSSAVSHRARRRLSESPSLPGTEIASSSSDLPS